MGCIMKITTLIFIVLLLSTLYYIIFITQEDTSPLWLFSVEWSPDGSEALIVGSSDETAIIMHYNGTAFKRLLRKEGGWFSRIYWSPDGKKALMYGPELYVYERGEINIISSVEDISRIYWSPSSQEALVSIYPQIPGGRCQQKIMKFDGQQFSDLISDLEDIDIVEWSPDGSEAIISCNRGVFSYTNDSISNLNLEASEVAWNPLYNFALISSDEVVIKYNRNGTDIVTTNITFSEVFWSSDGSEALILDQEGSIDKNEWYIYRNDSIARVMDDYHSLLPNDKYSWITISDVSWAPQVDKAIISLYFYEYGRHAENLVCFILEYLNNNISLISTYDGEYDEIAWDPEGNQALIIGQYWGKDSWHPGILKYDNDYVEEFNLSKKGRLFDISWSEKYGALIIGGPTIVYNYRDDQLIDLSDDFKNAL